MLGLLVAVSFLLRLASRRRPRRLLAALSVVADCAAVGAVLFLFVVRPFLFEVVAIPLDSRSMRPTLHEQDRVLTNKALYRFVPPDRGDIIVFEPPPELARTMPGSKRFIKRVVAVAGDRLAADSDGYLLLNGRKVREPHIAEPIRYLPFPPEASLWHDMKVRDGAIVVPEGCVFVLGDNRNASYDSADWGYLPREYIIGRAVAVVLPCGRARWLSADDGGDAG